MFKKYTWITMILLGVIVLASWTVLLPSPKASLEFGNPEIQTLGALAFGADNLLFAGDSDAASIIAFDVKDNQAAEDNSPVNVQQIDQKIAALLGTTTDAIRINDMAVHPVSQQIYLSITRGQGDTALPVMLRINKAGEIEDVSLEDIHFSKTSISNAPAKDAKDRRGRSLRTNTITDIAFANGHVYVAGLSNEEFASNFRQLSFPFDDEMKASSLEIFHVAHGQYETHAPIRTFMPYEVEDKLQILAAYTCTPLVAFPIEGLKDGSHVKGKTVAELGAGNSPLDIVSFEKEDKRYILVANNNRTLMLIDSNDLDGAKSLTEPLEKSFGTAGVGYTALPMGGVLQLAMLNEDHFLILKRQSDDGSLQLRSYPVSRM